jgi:hypothetical protein
LHPRRDEVEHLGADRLPCCAPVLARADAIRVGPEHVAEVARDMTIERAAHQLAYRLDIGRRYLQVVPKPDSSAAPAMPPSPASCAA